MRFAKRSALMGTLLFPVLCSASAIPERPYALIERYCLDCHDSDVRKGEVNLEAVSIDWSAKEDRHFWERVLKAVDDGLMPPEKKKQPTSAEREELTKWLDASLLKHVP
ncbi:MAG: hypothetical protein CMM29_01175, partial [Rhodospirillaceae bacterium]|nr:hypothetical protein [Rhodospirillaceae bacterium]